MTSRRDRRSLGRIVRDNGPKDPHEEIMDCIESTNDIVSHFLPILERTRDTIGDILKILEERE